MAVTQYSQRDPQWAKIPLGTSKKYTIGSSGCLITAISSMMADFGIPTDPARLNRSLIGIGGYWRDCYFVWKSIEGLGVPLVGMNYWISDGVVQGLRDALLKGYGVVAKVDAIPGGKVDQHWVRVIEISEDLSSATIMDPWQLPEKNMVDLAKVYGSKEKTKPSQLLLMVATYRQSTARSMEFTVSLPPEHVESLHHLAETPSP